MVKSKGERMKLIDKIINDLEEELSLRREDLGDNFVTDKIEIQMLGQMSLLMNKDIATKMTLAHTNDLDALLKGRSGESQLFRKVVKSNGLAFDELSEEAWIPKDAKFLEYYDSPYVKVTYLDPISAFTSKAVRAKEKNRILVHDALKIFGDSLATNITSNGGDAEYFKRSKAMKL